MDDIQIVGLYWQRSEDAISETASKYGDLCRAVARNILRDSGDVEECINDAYLAVWNSIPPQRPDSLAAYTAKITRRIAIKQAPL